MILDTPLGWGLLLLFGIFTGVLAGLLGIGGGLLLVPALIFSGATTIQATATSLIGVFLSATSGSLRNLKAGELNWKASLNLAAFGILTAQVGAWIGDRLSDRLLSLGFAILLLVTIFLMGLRKQLAKREQQREREAAAKITQEHEAQSGEPPSSEGNYRFVPMMGIGLLAGLLSGLFGVGGGVVMVPLQMLILGESIKAAVRTSLGAIVAIAASGLVQHTLNNNVLWIPGIALGLGGILGAQFGSRLLPKLPDQLIGVLFRLLLIALAVYMMIRATVG
ncbi:MAG: sulfite exporter TauE/SafE family protein [Elainellaceae cyanobacterium]